MQKGQKKQSGNKNRWMIDRLIKLGEPNLAELAAKVDSAERGLYKTMDTMEWYDDRKVITRRYKKHDLEGKIKCMMEVWDNPKYIVGCKQQKPYRWQCWAASCKFGRCYGACDLNEENPRMALFVALEDLLEKIEEAKQVSQ